MTNNLKYVNVYEKGMRTLGCTKMKKEKVMSTVKEVTAPPAGGDTGNTGNTGDGEQTEP